MKQFVFNTIRLLDVCDCVYERVSVCTKRCKRLLDQARCISANFTLLDCNVKSWQMIRHPVLIIPSLLPVRFLVNVWSIKRSFTNPSINIHILSFKFIFIEKSLLHGRQFLTTNICWLRLHVLNVFRKYQIYDNITYLYFVLDKKSILCTVKLILNTHSIGT